MIENRNDLLILCYFFFVHFICGPLIQYTQIVGWSVFQENMMFCLSKRMDSLNEDAAFLWFAVIFLWYWILRVCVYLLFCYFLFVRLNERRFSGKLNSYLNKIKKGKLKEFALWQRTNGKKMSSSRNRLNGDDIQWKQRKRTTQGHTHNRINECLDICAVTAIACRDMHTHTHTYSYDFLSVFVPQNSYAQTSKILRQILRRQSRFGFRISHYLPYCSSF